MGSQKENMGPVHSFLTKMTLKTAVVVFTACSFLKGFPFALESTDSLRVRKYTAKWKIALWHVSNFIFYFAATFQFTTYMYALTTDLRGNGFAIHTIYVMYSLFGVVFMLSVYMKPDVCILMLNQHDRLLQIIEGTQRLPFGVVLSIAFTYFLTVFQNSAWTFRLGHPNRS